MNKISITLREAKSLLKAEGIPWLLTRYNEYGVPNDLDILIHPVDFKNALSAFQSKGYKLLSHDHALGGRKRGMQMNCVKTGRIKIDLHQNFTWRKTEYMSQVLLWKYTNRKIESVSVSVPPQEEDVFLILINILFEKTYLAPCDVQLIAKYLPKITSDWRFLKQSQQYGWSMSYVHFTRWFSSLGINNPNYVFVPVWLVVFSYIEKGIHDRKTDFISFAYYVFFRTRAMISKVLPYE